MTTIYVVTVDYGYEGERVAGVYSSMETAQLVVSGGEFFQSMNIYDVEIDEPANHIREPANKGDKGAAKDTA